VTDNNAPPIPEQNPLEATHRDLELYWVDAVFAILTLPLLFWALMYAVTGNEQMYATRSGRMRVYSTLLIIEALLVGAIVWAIVR
jgi:hypothetical protein